MAGKKKQQLIFEVLTDRDWQEQIRVRDGLVLADVYCDWAGPCTAMQYETKKYKVEHPEGALLHLAVVSCDGVSFLHRFRGKSEPTWMFLVNGQMTNLYIGCDAPKLIEILNEEFTRELKVRRGEARRKILPFDRPTPAELARDERLDAASRAERQAEEDRIAAALYRIRSRAYERISAALRATTVVVVFPHALVGDQLPDIVQQLKNEWNDMGIDVEREEVVQINPDMANEMFYERKLPQHKELLEHLKTGRSVALMLKKMRPAEGGEPDKGGEGDAPPAEEVSGGDTYPIDIGRIERIVAETVYGFFPPDIEDDVEEELAVEEEEDESEEESIASSVSTVDRYDPKLMPRDMKPASGSPAAVLIRRFSIDKVNLPGIYTPFTPLSKSAALRVLFPAYTDEFYEMEELPPEPPPTIAMVFPVDKQREVIEAMTEFPGQVLKMGFYNDRKQRLAETAEDYVKLRRKGIKDSLVLSVDRRSSATVMNLTTLGPSYVSPTAKIGKEDERIFFSDVVVAQSGPETPPEIEAEPEVEVVAPPPPPPPPPQPPEGEEDGEVEVPPSKPASRQPSGRLPSVRASGKMPSVRASGKMPSVRASGKMPSIRPSGQPGTILEDEAPE